MAEMNLEFIKAREDVAWRSIDGQAVIVDGRFDKVHMLNAVATVVWEKIQEEIRYDHLIADLSGFYEVEKAALNKDIRDLLEQFQTKRLLSGAAR